MRQGLHGGDVALIASHLNCSAAELMDFSANINPRGLPQRAASEVARMTAKDLLRYPDWTVHPLRQRLAEQHSVAIESIVIGAGASALIVDVIRTVRASKALIFVPAFAEYSRACEACGTEVETLRLKPENDFAMDRAELTAALHEARPELVILNNPHNPSGALASSETIAEVLHEIKSIGATTLIDEAFIDYAEGAQMTSAAAHHADVVAIRSLTKFYGCPGLRVGYAVAHPTLAQKIAEQMPAWPVGSMALTALDAALQDRSYREATLAENARRRLWLRSQLTAIGLTVFPSAANFLLLQLPARWPDAASVRELLARRHRILVRDCSSFEGLQRGRFLRVAVLGDVENKLLVNALSLLV